jgi:hypothetical protein
MRIDCAAKIQECMHLPKDGVQMGGTLQFGGVLYDNEMIDLR